MPSPPSSADRHPLVARIAAQEAGSPALICEGQTIGYGELLGRAGAVAQGLLAKGLSPGDRVAIRGARTPQTFANLLGVLLAGGIYVPLGEKAPAARVAAMLADAGARFLLDDDATCEAIGDPAPEDEPPGYILYTSGSTGVPKGVQVTLDNLFAYISNLTTAYPIAAGARVAQLADLGFDASVHEMFGAWMSGACLCVVPTRNVLMWPRYFRDLAIEVALLVPSQVRLAADNRLLKPAMLPALRTVFVGAERVTGLVVRRLREAAPDAALVNLWGPTEGTVALTHHAITVIPRDLDDVPIGRPWPGHEIRVDEDGEMLAAGPQICRGYWRRPDLDAERFEVREGRRFYHTGDLAGLDPDDNFVFAGRRDRQVKINGHRIELDEVERAVRRHAGTPNAFVLADGNALVCMVGGDGVDEAALRAELPAYMIPTRYVTLDDVPLAASGKVDLQAMRTLL